MNAYEWMTLDIEKIDLKENYEILKDSVLRDTGLGDLISIKNKDDLIQVIRTFKKAKFTQTANDEYFISEKHKLAYCILKHERALFDKELGITKKHFVDKKEAKKWKDNLINMFHPDKDINNEFISSKEVTAKINKIYNQMVGKS